MYLDLGNTAQNHLLPTLAHHDHQKFEVYAFECQGIMSPNNINLMSIIGYPPKKDQQMKNRDINGLLVDLAGHTENNRLLVFAQKPAPVS